MRSGKKNIKYRLKRELREIVENDEEIANSIVRKYEENKEKDELSDTPIMPNEDIKMKRKGSKRMRKQYKKCLKADKIGDDQEMVEFEQADMRLEKTIKYLQKEENTNFWASYINDIKHLFGNKHQSAK